MTNLQVTALIVTLWMLFAAVVGVLWWAQRSARKEMQQGLVQIKEEFSEVVHVLADVQDLEIKISSTEKDKNTKVKKIRIMADMPAFDPKEKGAKRSTEVVSSVAVDFSTMLSGTDIEAGK